MNKINSFLEQTPNRRILLIRSIVLILFIRLSLSLFSFSSVRKFSNRLSRPINNSNKNSIEDILWSVRTASLYAPGVTCLTQAIVGQILLSRYNYMPILKIGVINKENFEAHAWIELNNEIILGNFEEEYVIIMEQI